MAAGLVAALTAGLGVCIGIWLKGRFDDRRDQNQQNDLEQRRQLYDRFGKSAYAMLMGNDLASRELSMYAEVLQPAAPKQVMLAVDVLMQELANLKTAKTDEGVRTAYAAWHSYLHAISEDLGFRPDN